MCCACRLLERTACQRQYDYDEVRHQSQGPWRDLVGLAQVRRCLKYVYSPCLVAVIVALLLSPDFYPWTHGRLCMFSVPLQQGTFTNLWFGSQAAATAAGHYEPDRRRPASLPSFRLSAVTTFPCQQLLGPLEF